MLLVEPKVVRDRDKGGGQISENQKGGDNFVNVQQFSALRMTGRRSHWTERGDDKFFFAFGQCGALVPSLVANGLIVMAPSCVNSLFPSAGRSLGRK